MAFPSKADVQRDVVHRRRNLPLWADRHAGLKPVDRDTSTLHVDAGLQSKELERQPALSAADANVSGERAFVFDARDVDLRGDEPAEWGGDLMVETPRALLGGIPSA